MDRFDKIFSDKNITDAVDPTGVDVGSVADDVRSFVKSKGVDPATAPLEKSMASMARAATKDPVGFRQRFPAAMSLLDRMAALPQVQEIMAAPKPEAKKGTQYLYFDENTGISTLMTTSGRKPAPKYVQQHSTMDTRRAQATAEMNAIEKAVKAESERQKAEYEAQEAVRGKLNKVRPSPYRSYQQLLKERLAQEKRLGNVA